MPLTLKDNLYWATRAIEQAVAVNEGGIPNNVTGPERTGGQSIPVGVALKDSYDAKVTALEHEMIELCKINTQLVDDFVQQLLIQSVSIRSELLQ